MPIVNSNSSNTYMDAIHYHSSFSANNLDLSSASVTRSTRSRKILSSGSPHRLKKDVGVSILLQQQHLPLCDHGPSSSGNNFSPVSTSFTQQLHSIIPPVQQHFLSTAPELLLAHCKEDQFISSAPPSLTFSKGTKAELLVTSRQEGLFNQRHRANNFRRSSREHSRDDNHDEDRRDSHCLLIMKARRHGRGTPSPSLSPHSSSPSAISVSISKAGDNAVSSLDHAYCTSLSLNAKAVVNANADVDTNAASAPFLPLSPPASATTACPPPSILSNTNSIALGAIISSPPYLDSDISSISASQELKDPSVDLQTNTASSSFPLTLVPSSLCVGSSNERQSGESDRDELRTKRKRSMSIASTSQPLSTAENDQQSKGVVAPSSPSSQALSVLPVTLDASVSVSASPVSNSSPSSLLEQTSSLYPPPDAIVSETATETADYAVPSTETESLDHRTSSTLSTLEAEVGTNGNNYQVRPAISYAGLIIQVLIESTKIKLTLSEIYSAIMNNHPYYRHAPNGWQNSVRNSLSLNKAFLKVDRTPEEPGHGCFWALRPDIRESNEQALHRKRSSADVYPSATKSGDRTAFPHSRPDLIMESSEAHVTHPLSSPSPVMDSAPSPAASEDADDTRGPRRSGRARRPPRPKEADEYVTTLHTRQSSLPNAPLSTPPSSPAPHPHDREATSNTVPMRKRSGSVRTERGTSATPDMNNTESSKASAVSTSTGTARKAFIEVDLSSIPGVVTTQRVRRPPQNLAEFVSSEDFKAAPCGKRQDRTLQPSTSSSSLSGGSVDSIPPREKKEAKRSKSEGNLFFCNSSRRTMGMTSERSPSPQSSVKLEPQHQGKLDHSATMPDLMISSHSHMFPAKPNGVGPAMIPLSALSHSKRGSQDFSGLMNSKKHRRESNSSNGSRRNSHHRALCSNKRHSHQHQLYRQLPFTNFNPRNDSDGKREARMASEDDWSDSDFDFLKDEEENYRLMRIRVRKIQRTRGRWSLRDEMMAEEECCDSMQEHGGDIRQEDEQSHARAEGEKIKLLMDPSVINYGFDSCDSEYILDYHQGPLFNNVTWPEFSDVKEDGSSGSSNSNVNNSSNVNSNGGNCGSNDSNNTSNNNIVSSQPANAVVATNSNLNDDISPSTLSTTVSTTNIAGTTATACQRTIDMTSEAITQGVSANAFPMSPIGQEFASLNIATPEAERVFNSQASISPLSPLSNEAPPAMSCIEGETPKLQQQVDQWALFVDHCDVPKTEDNMGIGRRSMEISMSGLSVSDELKGVISPLEHLSVALPDTEIAVVSAESNINTSTTVATTATAPIVQEGQQHHHDPMEEMAESQLISVTSLVVKEEIEAENFIGWSLCE
ncbi:hypothetical protein BX616_008731 [Lobosporangium transversale]|nr:hypothetical protein BX616_008731 [Lobosporangium transversale]